MLLAKFVEEFLKDSPESYTLLKFLCQMVYKSINN
jgi:hypothetical protein